MDQLKAQQPVLSKALSNRDEAQRQKLLNNYDRDVFNLKSKLNQEQDAQMRNMQARLASRQRMKEELAKEQAVESELDRITKVHVSMTELVRFFFRSILIGYFEYCTKIVIVSILQKYWFNSCKCSCSYIKCESWEMINVLRYLSKENIERAL